MILIILQNKIVIIITSLSSSLLSLCFLFFELFRVPRSFEFEPVGNDRDYHDDQDEGIDYFKYFDYGENHDDQE